MCVFVLRGWGGGGELHTRAVEEGGRTRRWRGKLVDVGSIAVAISAFIQDAAVCQPLSDAPKYV